MSDLAQPTDEVFVPSITTYGTDASEVETLRAENVRLRRFVAAWDRCESNRGKYSCTEMHDSRCEYQRAKNGCVCGADELEDARAALAPEGRTG